MRTAVAAFLCLALAPAVALALDQVTTIGDANALSPPAARHLVRLEPPGGYPVTYLLAIQRESSDVTQPGLSFFKSTDDGVSWGFYKTISASKYDTSTVISERDTVDLVKVGNDVAIVYSYDGPSILPDPVTQDPMHQVYFQWWRYDGLGGWNAQPAVLVFSPAAGTAYHRAELAIDSVSPAPRIWVQAFLRSGPACTTAACAACNRNNGDNYGNTVVMSMSADSGASFQQQPDLASTVCRAGGRFSSLGNKLIMLWNDYSANQNGTVVVTKFKTRNDTDAPGIWSSATNAFPDDLADGIFHGAALTAAVDGVGGMHLVYKDQNSQRLYYRYFNGASFGLKELVDGSHDDWALQASTAIFNGDLYVFANHLVGSDATSWCYPPVSLACPNPLNPNNYEIRMWKKASGWASPTVVDSQVQFKGYPTSPETLSTTASRVPCIFGQTPDANSAGIARIVFSGAAAPDFSVSTNPTSATTPRGTSTTVQLTVSPVGTFVGTVTLSATGVPANASVIFNPPSVTIGPGSAISTVTLSSTTAVTTGLYAISLTGVSGTLTHSVPFPWTITPGGIPVSQLTDPFTAATLDPSVWTTSVTAGTISVGGGVLTLSPDASTPLAGLFVTSVQAYTLNGSQASVRVAGTVDSGGNINNKFTLYKDGANELGWWYERGSLLGYYLVNNVETDPVLLSYSAPDHVYWRIRQAAGNVYWETSADGITYLQQGFSAVTNIAFSLDSLNVQLNVKAFGTGAATATPARYTNLNQ